MTWSASDWMRVSDAEIPQILFLQNRHKNQYNFHSTFDAGCLHADYTLHIQATEECVCVPSNLYSATLSTGLRSSVGRTALRVKLPAQKKDTRSNNGESNR